MSISYQESLLRQATRALRRHKNQLDFGEKKLLDDLLDYFKDCPVDKKIEREAEFDLKLAGQALERARSNIFQLQTLSNCPHDACMRLEQQLRGLVLIIDTVVVEVEKL